MDSIYHWLYYNNIYKINFKSLFVIYYLILSKFLKDLNLRDSSSIIFRDLQYIKHLQTSKVYRYSQSLFNSYKQLISVLENESDLIKQKACKPSNIVAEQTHVSYFISPNGQALYYVLLLFFFDQKS